jgi:hypothetical protein
MTDTLLFFAAIFTALTISEFSPTSSQGETDPVGLFSPRSHGVIETQGVLK